jgi:hypothetical protein
MENLDVLALESSRPEWQNPVLSAKIYENADKFEPSGFGVSREYKLYAEIGVTFYSNKAQMDRSILQAKRLLASRLFSEALRSVEEIRSAAFNSDAKTILDLCDDLDKIFSAKE